jgi:hypothetical protein
MNKYIALILAIVLPFIFVYLGTAFVLLNLNPLNWDQSTRFVYFIASSTCALAASFIVIIYKFVDV